MVSLNDAKQLYNNVKQLKSKFDTVDTKQLIEDVKRLNSKLGPIPFDRKSASKYIEDGRNFIDSAKLNDFDTMADIASPYIPVDPNRIIEGAKGLDEFKSAYFPRPEAKDLISKASYLFEDLGAGAGVGMVAGGAAIQNAATKLGFENKGKAVRDFLTKQGIKTVLDDDKARGTGGLLVGAASLPVLGAGIYGTNKALDYASKRKLENEYGPNYKNMAST